MMHYDDVRTNRKTMTSLYNRFFVIVDRERGKALTSHGARAVFLKMFQKFAKTAPLISSGTILKCTQHTIEIDY